MTGKCPSTPMKGSPIMAHVADPILIKPANQTDRILRIAESMPGATYETKVVKRLLTKNDWLALHQGQEIPSLYRLEATNLSLDGFYDKISKNSDGTDKHVGSMGVSGDLFAYDAYIHGEDRDETVGVKVDTPITSPFPGSDEIMREPESKFYAIGTSGDYDFDKATLDKVMKQVSGRAPYQPLQSGVWVDVAENEDDIKELHPDPSDTIVNLPGSDDDMKRDLAMIKISETLDDKLEGLVMALREFILEAVADVAAGKL